MPKQLEDETITVLRAMASGVGVKVMMSDGKRELIKLIRETVDKKAALPIRMAISMPREEEGASHDNIRNALKPLIERGLIDLNRDRVGLVRFADWMRAWPEDAYEDLELAISRLRRVAPSDLWDGSPPPR